MLPSDILYHLTGEPGFMKKVFFSRQQFTAVSYGYLLIFLLLPVACEPFQAGTSAVLFVPATWKTPIKYLLNESIRENSIERCTV